MSGTARSGRKPGRVPALLVEDALALDLRAFRLAGVSWRSGERCHGTASWCDHTAVSWWSYPYGLRLGYLAGDDREPVETIVHVARFLFACPAPGCSTRCRRLYLPAGASRFACRLCHGLQYRSAQEHDPRVNRLRRTIGTTWRDCIEDRADGWSASYLTAKALTLGPLGRRRTRFPGAPVAVVEVEHRTAPIVNRS